MTNFRINMNLDQYEALTDEQFDTLFDYVDNKVEFIVDASVKHQDSEILEEWEDLFDVHTVLEEAS